MNEVQANENLSAKGKKAEMEGLSDVQTGKISELNNVCVWIDALLDGIDLEMTRYEAISESDFSMTYDNTQNKAQYSIFSELKSARLFREFEFCALSRDKNGKFLVDYTWLLRNYEGAI